ncbi:MAG: ATP-binding protein [Desulfomonile tiedjei]|nr:ATP-binding protein [Desulfomonile tiedjei]
MKIPKRLDTLLKKERGLRGAVDTTLDRFEPWLKANRMVFFCGFTDHGVEHIESVMQFASALITDKALKQLTARDSAACILSILLHDCAMHLSEDGFQLLISRSNGWQPKSNNFSFQPMKWKEEWEKFLGEASRFDDQKLKDLFESAEPISRPPDNPLEWTERHKRLVGEFLRRHHGTLAYEIALAGVPGPGDARLRLSPLPEGLADVIGFIAWSHSRPIREGADRLRLVNNERQVWRGVHAPFLMGLLRIADYLEIQAPRAPEEILRVRSLHSSASLTEWEKHKAVRDIRPHEGDRECLWIDAEPKNVKTFLALQRLFIDIQAELDATWALWGEVYGSHSKLRNLGITLRRIRSTLDDLTEFEKKVAFIPVHAKFGTADAELLKLMVGPLYSGNPSYGVRELIQNAVDACLERDDYMKQHGLTTLDLADLPGDVVVTLEEDQTGGGWLTVEDSGIGMTRDVILNYFLTAGASFRASERWHELHAAGNEPRVTRSGRFGVGLLAAFLLGSEIEVSTRHVDDRNGIEFTCHLEDREIELRHNDRSIGTTIRVRIGQEQMDQLTGFPPYGATWDWYTLSYPKVVRRIKCHQLEEDFGRPAVGPEGLVELPPAHILPEREAQLPFEWRRLTHPNFDDVQWTWGGPDLVCNGIRVGQCVRHDILSGGYRPLCAPFDFEPSYGPLLRGPSLSLFDSRGNVPINLNRTNLSGPLPMEIDDALATAVCRDILAFFLVTTPQSLASCINSLLIPEGCEENEGLTHPAFDRLNTIPFWHWIAWASDGILLEEPQILGMARLLSAWFFPRPPERFMSRYMDAIMVTSPRQVGTFVSRPRFTPYTFWPDSSKAIDQWMDAIMRVPTSSVDGPSTGSWDTDRAWLNIWGHFESGSRAALTPAKLWTDGLSGQYSGFENRNLSNDVVLFWTGENPEEWLDLPKLTAVEPRNDKDVVAFWKLADPEGPELPMSQVGRLWKDLFRQAVIPFDLKDRRKQLAHAYKELAEEVERWEQAGTYELGRRRQKGSSDSS